MVTIEEFKQGVQQQQQQIEQAKANAQAAQNQVQSQTYLRGTTPIQRQQIQQNIQDYRGQIQQAEQNYGENIQSLKQYDQAQEVQGAYQVLNDFINDRLQSKPGYISLTGFDSVAEAFRNAGLDEKAIEDARKTAIKVMEESPAYIGTQEKTESEAAIREYQADILKQLPVGEVPVWKPTGELSGIQSSQFQGSYLPEGYNKVIDEYNAKINQISIPAGYKNQNITLPFQSGGTSVIAPISIGGQPTFVSPNVSTNNLMKFGYVSPQEQQTISSNLPKGLTYNTMRGLSTTYTSPLTEKQRELEIQKLSAFGIRNPEIYFRETQPGLGFVGKNVFKGGEAYKEYLKRAGLSEEDVSRFVKENPSVDTILQEKLLTPKQVQISYSAPDVFSSAKNPIYNPTNKVVTKSPGILNYVAYDFIPKSFTDVALYYLGGKFLKGAYELAPFTTRVIGAGIGGYSAGRMLVAPTPELKARALEGALIGGGIAFLPSLNFKANALRTPEKLTVESQPVNLLYRKIQISPRGKTVITPTGQKLPGKPTQGGITDISRSSPELTKNVVKGKNWFEIQYTDRYGNAVGTISRKGFLGDYKINYVTKNGITTYNIRKGIFNLGKVKVPITPSAFQLTEPKLTTEIIKKTDLINKPIKDPFYTGYHGTTKESAEMILRQGLLPAKQSRGITQQTNVFVTQNLPKAEGYAGRAAYGKGLEIGGGKQILQIEMPKSAYEKLWVGKNELGEDMFSSIPKRYIKTIGANGKVRIVKETNFKRYTQKLIKTGKSDFELVGKPKAKVTQTTFRETGILPAETTGQYIRKDYLTGDKIKLIADLGKKRAVLSNWQPKDIDLIRGISIGETTAASGQLKFKTPRFKQVAGTQTDVSLIYTLEKPSNRISFKNLGEQIANSQFMRNKKATFGTLVSPQIEISSAKSDLLLDNRVTFPRGQIETALPKLEYAVPTEVKIGMRNAVVPISLSQLKASQQQIQIPKSRLTEISKQAFPKAEQIIKSNQVQRVNQEQIQIQIPKLRQIPQLGMIAVPKPAIRTQTPRVEIRIPKEPIISPPFPRSSDNRITRTIRSFKIQAGYTPEVRRGGKFFAVSKPTSLPRAIGIGKAIARGTLAASFRVRGPKGFVGLQAGEEFRLGGGRRKISTVLVQKAPSRIKSFGEIKEIKLARRGMKLF